MPATRKPAPPKLSMSGLVRNATTSDRTFMYANVAAGLLTLVAFVLRYGVSLPTLAAGGVLFFIIMSLYVIFRVLVRLIRGGNLKTHALALSWTCLSLFIAGSFLLFTSIFFDNPLHIKKWIENQINGEISRSHAPATDGTSLSLAPVQIIPDDKLVVADRRSLLIKEIKARKAKCVQYLSFFDNYEKMPQSYRLNGSYLYAAKNDETNNFLELDSRHLPSVVVIDRLRDQAELEMAPKRGVEKFKQSYARFLAAVDDPMNKRILTLGAYNIQKFAREALTDATFALCALDADLGDAGPFTGPIPFGCAPVNL